MRTRIAVIVLAIVAAIVLASAVAVALWSADGDEPRSTETQTR